MGGNCHVIGVVRKNPFHFSCSLVKYATQSIETLYHLNATVSIVGKLFSFRKSHYPSQVNLISFLLGIFCIEHFFNVISFMFLRPILPSLEKMNMSGGFPLCLYLLFVFLWGRGQSFLWQNNDVPTM